MIIKKKQIVEEILTIRERVVYLYNRYPSTVESDKILESMYHHTFARNLSLLALPLASIRRCGRDLRSKYPERYRRTQEGKLIAKQREAVFRNVFTPAT